MLLLKWAKIKAASPLNANVISYKRQLSFPCCLSLSLISLVSAADRPTDVERALSGFEVTYYTLSLERRIPMLTHSPVGWSIQARPGEGSIVVLVVCVMMSFGWARVHHRVEYQRSESMKCKAC